jgi:hypothetical protein
MTRKDQAAGRKRVAAIAAATVKIGKLERLASDAGASPAESENARHKASVLRRKVAALGPPPLPGTLDEMLARRKRPLDPKIVAKARAERAKHHDNETNNVVRLEDARPRGRAPDNETKPITKGKGGRPCKGDRPMTGYERLKAYRARQRANSAH